MSKTLSTPNGASASRAPDGTYAPIEVPSSSDDDDDEPPMLLDGGEQEARAIPHHPLDASPPPEGQTAPQGASTPPLPSPQPRDSPHPELTVAAAMRMLKELEPPEGCRRSQVLAGAGIEVGSTLVGLSAFSSNLRIL